MFNWQKKRKLGLFFIGGLLVSFLIGIMAIDRSNAIVIQESSNLIPQTNLSRNLESDNDTFLTSQVQTAQLFKRDSFNRMNEFPLGTYDRVDKPEHISVIKDLGFNMVMPYTNPYAKKGYERIQTYLDAANEAGIKVVLEPFRESIKERDFAEITSFVNEFKNNPAVAAWYLYDEPVYGKIPVDLLEEVYDLIKQEDSIHPVILDFAASRSGSLTDYQNSFDIGQINHYPIRENSPPLEALTNFQANVKDNVRLLGSKPFWLVIQSFAGDKKWRLPSAEEQKYMLYSGLLNGADALFFYGYHRAPVDWQNSVVKPTVQELNNYLPAIAEGAVYNAVSSGEDGIQAIAYKQPGKEEYIVIAVNHELKRQESQINLSITNNNSAIEVLGENRTLNKSGNNFSDSFEPYGVHVYRVS